MPLQVQDLKNILALPNKTSWSYISDSKMRTVSAYWRLSGHEILNSKLHRAPVENKLLLIVHFLDILNDSSIFTLQLSKKKDGSWKPSRHKKANRRHSFRGDKCKQQLLIQSVAWPHDTVSVIREGRQECLVNISTENRKLEWVANWSVYMSVTDWPRYTDIIPYKSVFFLRLTDSQFGVAVPTSLNIQPNTTMTMFTCTAYSN